VAVKNTFPDQVLDLVTGVLTESKAA
jgi:hypothetical protein